MMAEGFGADVRVRGAGGMTLSVSQSRVVEEAAGAGAWQNRVQLA